MSAGSCVASRSRSRLDISASVTWLNRDSRRASNLSRYAFIFLLSIRTLLYRPCLFKTLSIRFPPALRFKTRDGQLLLLIRQTPRDHVRAVELFDEEDARHLVRQRQARERPANVRTLLHTLAHAQVSAHDEGNLFDRTRLPLFDPRGQLLRTPAGRPPYVEQNRQSV